MSASRHLGLVPPLLSGVQLRVQLQPGAIPATRDMVNSFIGIVWYFGSKPFISSFADIVLHSK